MANMVDGIKHDLYDMMGDINDMKGDVGEIKDNLDEIMDDLDEIKDDIGEIKDGMGDIKDDLGKIKHGVVEIKCSCSATPSPPYWRLTRCLREPDRTGRSQMVFPAGPICQLQHCARSLPKGNCCVVLTRWHVQGVGINRFPPLDTWKTCVLPIFRSPTSGCSTPCFRSGVRKEHS